MKRLLKWLASLALIGGIVAAVRRWLKGSTPPAAHEEGASVTEVQPAPTEETLDESELGGEVDPELLKILVDPGDKGPLELSEDGKWLINPRNGYRYPIRRGIPVMLLEEGEKYRDPSLIRETPAEGASAQE